MNSETLLLLAKVLSSPEYVTALISTSLISFIGYRCLTFTTLSSSSYPLLVTSSHSISISRRYKEVLELTAWYMSLSSSLLIQRLSLHLFHRPLVS
jgi:hypothetical protein